MSMSMPAKKRLPRQPGLQLLAISGGALLFLEVLQNQGALAIYSCLHQKVIGNISFYPSFASSKFELGYALNSDYWQRGYMTEALQALCKTLGDKEVLAYVYPNNEASLRLLQKCNFESARKLAQGGTVI